MVDIVEPEMFDTLDVNLLNQVKELKHLLRRSKVT